MGNSQCAHVSSLLCALYWFPVGFWVQFNVILVTYKAWYCIGPEYLRDRLSPIVYANPVCSSRLGVLPSINCCLLVGPRKYAFFIASPTLWNNILLKIRMASSLLSWKPGFGPRTGVDVFYLFNGFCFVLWVLLLGISISLAVFFIF